MPMRVPIVATPFSSSRRAAPIFAISRSPFAPSRRNRARGGFHGHNAALALAIGDGARRVVLRDDRGRRSRRDRSEEQTSELQSLMRISYAVFCLQKKKTIQNKKHT